VEYAFALAEFGKDPFEWAALPWFVRDLLLRGHRLRTEDPERGGGSAESPDFVDRDDFFEGLGIKTREVN